MRRALCALLFLLAASPASGQVDRTAAAFQMTHFEKVGKDYYYRYRVVGHGGTGERISDVYLQIAQPRTERRPQITGKHGQLLFDALAEAELAPPFGHAPLFITTPANWSAAIYIQGVLSWGADRWASGPNHGVLTGRTLEGFELMSPALPALRRFRAVPYRPIAALSEDPLPQDTTWVLYTGVVLAPGWESDLVTGSYLKEQITTGCSVYLIDNCGRYLRLADDILAAEGRADDRGYARAVAAARNHLRDDKVTHRNARFALDAALSALAVRPPSRRNR